jgi:ubiquinone/menaquinone biosynthesis C-methylase UbiE
MHAVQVLDVGSGPAHYAVRFAKALGCQIVCLDFSEAMLVKARENVEREGLGTNFRFIEGNITYVSLPAESFDAVTVISVLHYLLLAGIRVALKKSYAALKKGGKIVIVEYWANEDLTEVEEFALKVTSRNRARQGVRANFLKEVQYRKLLEDAGFTNVKVSYVSERVYLDKYLGTELKSRPKRKKEESIRVAIIEAKK